MSSLETLQFSLLEKIKEMGLFLVDFSFDARNSHLKIVVDSLASSISVQQCAEINRHVNQHQMVAETDYGIEVSSPGLTFPFIVPEQYEKNLKKSVSVMQNDGTVTKGVLSAYGDEEIVLSDVKEKESGEKKEKRISRNTVKKTTLNLTF